MTTNRAPKEPHEPKTKAEVQSRINSAMRQAGMVHDILQMKGTISPNAQVVLQKRYLAKDPEGNVLEDADGMFRRVARNLSQADLNYENDEQKRQQTEDRFYSAMKSLHLLPNSPTLMNAERELQQLSACFVLPVEDSLDAIFDSVKQTAIIHKSGGGTGFSFSRIRPEGDTVGSTGGVASGPVSFIKSFDTATDVVKQGGTRRGANMGILEVTHPDIMKFISAKADSKELQNFNISVAATDDFMNKVETSEDFQLVNPRTGEITGTLNAREVFEQLVNSAWASGDPGLIFIDAINRDNPNPQLGRIESTNPCVTGDTLVYTATGLQRIDELAESGQENLSVTVDQRLHDMTTHPVASVVLTGIKPVFRLDTEEGYQVRLTAGHRLMTQSGWVRADELKPGDRIHILNRKGKFGYHGTAESGAEAAHAVAAQRKDPDAPALSRLEGQENLLNASEKAQTAFVHTLFKRYGEVMSFPGKVRDQLGLASVHRPLLQQIQRMLLNLNIKSVITRCQAEDAPHRLNLHISDLQRMLQRTALNREENHFTATFTGLTPDGTEEVYDLTEPATHSFIANGFVAHNCGEQPLLPYESCNLASINLARMLRFSDEGTEIDWDTLLDTVDTAVHLLDNVIDMNRYPIPAIEEMTKRTRRIGLGVMGFADLLVTLGIPYDSVEALNLAEALLGAIKDQAHRASMKLARERGAFAAWENSIYSGSPNNPSPKMRNSAPTTIAPTGTISIIAGVSSGIEPLFALAYVRNVMDNTRLIETNPQFEAIAKHEGFHSEELMRRIAQTGTLQGLNEVPTWVKEVFRTSHDISPEWHVNMQAAAQKHVDNAVSKTINFPASATPEEVGKAFMHAYKSGCKGITVYRDSSKAGQVLSTTPELKTEAPQSGVSPRARPQVVRGVTERVRTGHGNMYVTINFDEQQTPFEVFANLGKAGGCDSAQIEAISRLVSLALRSGIDISVILEQIAGITCCPAWDNGTRVQSSPDALAVAFKRQTGGISPADNAHQNQIPMSFDPPPVLPAGGRLRCPECSGPLTYQEGCAMCPACSWNRCD